MLRKEPAESEGQEDEQLPHWLSELEWRGGCPLLVGGERSIGLVRGWALQPEPAFLRNDGRWPGCWFSRQAEHEFGAQQSRGACN